LAARAVDVCIVEACLRDGAGGSPTAVVPNGADLGDAEMARIPARLGTSHVAVLYPDGAVRFFTTECELPSCGHGTVAAIAVRASQVDGLQGGLRLAGRNLEATCRVETRSGHDVVEAWFAQGLIEQRAPTPGERAAFLSALGLEPDALHPTEEAVVASPGRERLLLPVLDRSVLSGLQPDQQRLTAASRRYGQLGCFVYVPPSPTERASARMFAPAVGVPEDVANANSCGCLAAHLLGRGHDPSIAVDQGDALGRPSTVLATAVRGAHGITTRIGGHARIAGP
jgi:trans-2,3-dihydro-3-hydroxyanthranilate isomerase